MLRGLLLLAAGFAVAHRLEQRYARKCEHDHDRDEAWTNGEDSAVVDSFPASDPPAFNAGTASSPGPH